MAVVDATGKFLENTTIYPTPPHNKTDEAPPRLLRELIARHDVELIAIGTARPRARPTPSWRKYAIARHS